MKSKQLILILSGLSGALAVGLGAFGAHGLKPQLAAESYANFQTAVLYHFIHTLALLWVAGQIDEKSKITSWAAAFFGAGLLLFSGSLYLLSTRELSGIQASWLGPITPVGGLCFICGWLSIAISAFSNKKSIL